MQSWSFRFLFASSFESLLLEVYDGVLNWSTKHAAVVTQTHCFVWNYGDVDNVKVRFN
jgi:hypothetical protein